ncbi:hypothetical protein QBC37DRAFT_280309 [Rhypophila decipiens]|uniref:DUF5672 domain-containing protein n=1 Tax=Rhypophila decipiens TaxID=261697 RepID=A0AAN6YDK7_9PEZI|nr:hypothetical protein QBC37DRAFT_280309 [Rhypophila decipiens]
MTIADLFRALVQLIMAAWARTSKRIRMLGGALLFISITSYLAGSTIQTAVVSRMPSVSLNYDRNIEKQASKFNETKVALLIENRPNPILAPLTLHFMSVVPPDWRFRFMGSLESVEFINKSVAIREHVAAGKLDLTYIPSNMSTGSQEEISRFLTDLWLYETVLQPAEHLLIFQTDSILCANSRQTLNDFLDYDWVGAPWNPNGKFGGNGGLSLRKVSTIIDILRNQKRKDNSEPEDVWLTDRLGHRPNAKLANGTVSGFFSGEMHTGEKTSLDLHGDEEIVVYKGGNQTRLYNSTLEAAKDGAYIEGIDDWRVGQYEPMGYHTGASGTTLHGEVWGTPELRKHIWDYCPEVKMTLKMDAAKYFSAGGCGSTWKKKKRDLDDGNNPGGGGEGEEWPTEVIDGVEYPLLSGLVPW